MEEGRYLLPSPSRIESSFSRVRGERSSVTSFVLAKVETTAPASSEIVE